MEVADDHWERLQAEEEVRDPLSSIIRDSSTIAGGYYVGGSSYLTLGRLLGSALQFTIRAPANFDADAAAGEEENNNSCLSGGSDKSDCDISDFSKQDCSLLFEAYMRYVSLQFPVINSNKLRSIQARRSDLDDPFEIALLHLIYAIGGRSLELAGKGGRYRCEEHYNIAMGDRDVIIGYIDRRSIIYLALASAFCQRAPRQPGPWTMIGLAVKLCISLGLHRKPAPTQFGLAAEFDKRLFWCCYSLDRDVTIVSGRPPSISDHDIDTPLPLDVDEDSASLDDFNRAMRRNSGTAANPPTSLTNFIHTIRMKRIESAIQHEIYRVDKNVNASYDIIDGFLQQLSQWKEAITGEQQSPGRENSVPTTNVTDSWSSQPSRIIRSIQYHSCVRFLLFPQLTVSVVDDSYLKHCASACARICESYRQLHDAAPTYSYTPSDIQALFIAGLCLIYCTWHTPQAMPITISRNAVTDCSIILYVMTERWKTAQKYRNTFERVKRSIFDHIASGDHEPRAALGLAGSETRSILHDLDQEFSGNAMWSLSHMLADISGEQIDNNAALGREQLLRMNSATLSDDLSYDGFSFSLTGDAQALTNFRNVHFGTVIDSGL